MSRPIQSATVGNAALPSTTTLTHVMDDPDPIWVEDVPRFLSHWKEFWPGAQLSLTNKVNACVRLLLYVGIAVSLTQMNKNPVMLASILSAVITFLYYMGNLKQKEGYTSDPLPARGRRVNYLRPSPDNPMANILTMKDRKVYEQVPYAKISKEANDNFTRRLYSNFDDAWGVQNSQRQFMKLPEKDLGKFAEYAYGDMLCNRKCKFEIPE